MMVLANLVAAPVAARIISATFAAVDIKTPILNEIAKPLFDAAPFLIGILAILFLVRQMQQHREGIGILVAETGLFAGAGIGVLALIRTVVGI